MFDEFTGLSLDAGDTASGVTTDVSVPTSQPSFDTAGSMAGTAKNVLTSATQLVTQVTGAVTSITGAVSSAGTAIGQQRATQQVAQLQSNTAIAQAQAAFNRAAGVVSSNPVLMIGLMLGALWLLRRGR